MLALKISISSICEMILSFGKSLYQDIQTSLYKGEGPRQMFQGQNDTCLCYNLVLFLTQHIFLPFELSV